MSTTGYFNAFVKNYINLSYERAMNSKKLTPTEIRDAKEICYQFDTAIWADELEGTPEEIEKLKKNIQKIRKEVFDYGKTKNRNNTRNKGFKI